VIGLFKGTQGLLALTSAGILAYFFKWPVAVALMGMLFFHEYGHVHAMRRSGLKVKGIYFIPIVGAAAVAEDLWRTRSQQAYIALSGPLWGAVLTAIPFGVVVATGDRYPMVAAITVIWAFLNLLNLLPINPLDGGRVLSAIGHSLHTVVGLALSFGTLLLGMVLTIWAKQPVFFFVLLVGLLELAGERSAVSRIRRLSLSERLKEVLPEELARLRVLTRPGFPASSETKLRQIELARNRQLLRIARIEPMKVGRAVLWFAVYAALVVGLSGMLYWIATVFPDLRALVTELQ
jgi:Zn-dependent protease